MFERRRFFLLAMLLPLIGMSRLMLHLIDLSTQQVDAPEIKIPSAPLSSGTVYLPLVTALYPPAEAPSYYLNTIDPTSSYNLGYALGIHDSDAPGTQDNLVILDYGYPGANGGVYGAKLTFSPQIFIPGNNIANLAFQFAKGYYYGTGSDTSSRVRLVIGVNNCCNENTLTFFQTHGSSWGQTVNSARALIVWPYSNQVDAVGGSDIEMDWNDPYTTARWFDNFMAASSCAPGPNSSVDGCFYNFGNLTISISGTTCATGETSPWRACDVWYVSWGAQKNGMRYARPLPEIYVRYNPSYPQYPWGQNATAWKDLSLFSANQMGAGKMYFVGTLTQRARCGEGCGSGNNYPWEGYSLLYNALGSNSTTSMSMRWSTDITIQPTP